MNLLASSLIYLCRLCMPQVSTKISSLPLHQHSIADITTNNYLTLLILYLCCLCHLIHRNGGTPLIYPMLHISNASVTNQSFSVPHNLIPTNRILVPAHKVMVSILIFQQNFFASTLCISYLIVLVLLVLDSPKKSSTCFFMLLTYVQFYAR